MTVPGNIDALLLGGQRGYQIERSLRFNSADSAYLNRTPASAGNRKTWTWSGWAKICKDSTSDRYIFAGNSATTDTGFFGFGFTTASTTLFISGWATNWRITTQVFRDFSAWYHIVVALDTTQATANDRVKVYVNGVQVTAFSTTNNPTQNADLGVNTAAVHYLSSYNASAAMFDGYLTEVHFIDGQALTPSSFGETDTITGVWKPKKYAGTYGANGFYLKFADNSGTTSTTLGKDSSGNGNNWTPNNFSVTAGAGNDSMIDTPTPYAGGNGGGNYCTLNSVYAGAVGLTNGNLLWRNTGNNQGCIGTIEATTGKWYAEFTVDYFTAGYDLYVGVNTNSANIADAVGNRGGMTTAYAYFGNNGNKSLDGSSSSYGSSYTTNDVIGIALDKDNNTLTFYKNGVSQGQITSVPAGKTLFWAGGGGGSTANSYGGTWNFGQRAFAYTPPSGFLALNTQNLPEPSIKKPSSYFNSVLWTGNGSSQAITGVGHQPDFLWSKARNQAYSHRLHDAVRGREQSLLSNSNGAEFTQSNSISSFDTDGFTVGSDGSHNGSAVTYVGWSWKESATPGFDIVTYTGNGTAGRTVSHNLGVTPSMVIIKSRSLGTNWYVWHQKLTQPDYQLYLNLTDAQDNFGITALNDKAPTSTVFELPGTGYGSNNTSETYVAYLWSEVAGFSKFGSYTGNGSTDGPFVFCGFRPRWVMIRDITTSGYSWIVIDSARNTYNVMNYALRPNWSDAEITSSNPNIDFLSNGFKLRTSWTDMNASSDTFIFAAFAETPAKYALAR